MGNMGDTWLWEASISDVKMPGMGICFTILTKR